MPPDLLEVMATNLRLGPFVGGSGIGFERPDGLRASLGLTRIRPPARAAPARRVGHREPAPEECRARSGPGRRFYSHIGAITRSISAMCQNPVAWPPYWQEFWTGKTVSKLSPRERERFRMWLAKRGTGPEASIASCRSAAPRSTALTNGSS